MKINHKIAGIELRTEVPSFSELSPMTPEEFGKFAKFLFEERVKFCLKRGWAAKFRKGLCDAIAEERGISLEEYENDKGVVDYCSAIAALSKHATAELVQAVNQDLTLEDILPKARKSAKLPESTRATVELLAKSGVAWGEVKGVLAGLSAAQVEAAQEAYVAARPE